MNAFSFKTLKKGQPVEATLTSKDLVTYERVSTRPSRRPDVSRKASQRLRRGGFESLREILKFYRFPEGSIRESRDVATFSSRRLRRGDSKALEKFLNFTDFRFSERG